MAKPVSHDENCFHNDRLPETGFVRLKQIIGPNRPIPVSKSTWWEGVRSGAFRSR